MNTVAGTNAGAEATDDKLSRHWQILLYQLAMDDICYVSVLNVSGQIPCGCLETTGNTTRSNLLDAPPNTSERYNLSPILFGWRPNDISHPS